MLIYFFTNGELTSTKYLFQHRYSDDARFIQDYDSFKESLTKKYGKPFEDNRYFTSSTYDDEYQNWKMTLSIGELSFFTTWIHKKTKIVSALYGNNYEITFAIEYTSLENEDVVNKINENKLMDNL